MDIQLTKVAVLSEYSKDGGACFHRFVSEKDGSVLMERMTVEEYAKLTGEGGGSFVPKKEGYKWEGAQAGPEFDTPSGLLEKDCFAVIGDSVFCNVDGKEIVVDGKELVDQKVPTIKLETEIAKRWQ